MKTIRQIIQVSIVVLFFLTISISAQAFSGNNLAKYCQSGGKEDPLNSHSSLCFGLLDGFINGLEYGFLISEKKTKLFCKPKNIPPQQIMKIMNKYLDEHPEDLHYEFGQILIEALIEAFPCKNKYFKPS